MNAAYLTALLLIPHCSHAATKWRQHGLSYRAFLTSGRTNRVRPSRSMSLVHGAHKPPMSSSGEMVVGGVVHSSKASIARKTEHRRSRRYDIRSMEKIENILRNTAVCIKEHCSS